MADNLSAACHLFMLYGVLENVSPNTFFAFMDFLPGQTWSIYPELGVHLRSNMNLIHIIIQLCIRTEYDTGYYEYDTGYYGSL